MTAGKLVPEMKQLRKDGQAGNCQAPQGQSHFSDTLAASEKARLAPCPALPNIPGSAEMTHWLISE